MSAMKMTSNDHTQTQQQQQQQQQYGDKGVELTATRTNLMIRFQHIQHLISIYPSSYINIYK